MKLDFHPAFASDFEAAAAYLEKEHPGLGNELIKSVEHELNRLLKMPQLWRLYRGNIRRVWVKRFRYGIFYSYFPENELIEIYSLTHLSQDETAWLHRT